MKYRLLGPSGLRVSELALGTMTFGPEWGFGADHAGSQALFDAYVEAGGNFLDTANRYTEGTSEKWLGEFVKSDRERFVIATKYTLFTRRDDPNFGGNHRKNLVQSLEASLRRLDMDYVDLFWVHAWDFTTPIEEVMRALDDMVRAGKVLHIGISDTPAWIVSRANTLAQLRGWTPFTAAQLRYSLIDRSVEADLMPMARYFGMAVTPWSVLGAGVLTGKYNAKTKPEVGRAKEGAATVARNLEIAQAVIEIGQQIGCTPGQVAIRWMMDRPGTVVPLIGARNVEQLRDNLGALEVQLDAAQTQRLDEVSAIDLGFPHNFLSDENILDVIHGGTQSKIEFPPR